MCFELRLVCVFVCIGVSIGVVCVFIFKRLRRLKNEWGG